MYIDFSLHFRSCCLLRICRKFGPQFASHYKPVENEVKFVELSEHVRRTKSSIKKRIIVRRTVRSMFGEQTFAQLRTGLKQYWTELQPRFVLPVRENWLDVSAELVIYRYFGVGGAQIIVGSC